MAELEHLTLVDVFKLREQANLDEILFSFVDELPLKAKDVIGQATFIQRALSRHGIRKGDRIAILGENSPRWGVAYLACGTAGMVNVPILPDFHKSEVHHILKNSEAKVLFISAALFHKILDSNFTDLKLVVVLDDKEQTLSGKTVTTYSELIKEGESLEDVKIDMNVEEDDLLEILYTSGTTGHSKGVMLSHANITTNAVSVIDFIEIRSTDRMVSILPLAHSYECTCGLITSFLVGAKVFYIKGPPTAQTLLPAVEKIKPTIILSVPLIMEKIYKKKVLSQINSKAITKQLYTITPMRKLLNRIAGRKLYQAFGGELRFMVFGGAATPLDVEQFLTEGGFPYITGYGLTESAPILTANPEGKVKHQSAGIPVPPVQIRIDDPDPVTGIGEIVATGPNIMKGYYRNEEVTKQTFTKDGWLITGDRGYLDEDNYLFIKGRSKNLIVGPSGENIYPEEIEFHFSQNTYVLESLVFDEDGRIVARVHLDYDALDRDFNTSQLDESEAAKLIEKLLEDLRKEVNGKLANYSRVHRIIEQPEEFEKTPTKKIKRYLYT